MQNSVALLGYYGGDKRVCLSAWQSTSEELGIELPENIPDRVDMIFDYIAKTKKKSPADLLKFLAENNHKTPFEKAILDFQLTGDVASHIHSIKHRISSINAESARYKEIINDRFYLPEDWQGIETTEDVYFGTKSCQFDAGIPWLYILEKYSELGFELYHQIIKDLTPKLGRKRAKESARYFLGYNTQICYDWQMNFSSFVNIQQLRNEEHAQKEIHYLVNTMLYLAETIPTNPFKYCLKAFDLKSDPEWILPCAKNGL